MLTLGDDSVEMILMGKVHLDARQVQLLQRGRMLHNRRKDEARSQIDGSWIVPIQLDRLQALAQRSPLQIQWGEVAAIGEQVGINLEVFDGGALRHSPIERLDAPAGSGTEVVHLIHLVDPTHLEFHERAVAADGKTYLLPRAVIAQGVAGTVQWCPSTFIFEFDVDNWELSVDPELEVNGTRFIKTFRVREYFYELGIDVLLLILVIHFLLNVVAATVDNLEVYVYSFVHFDAFFCVTFFVFAETPAIVL